MSSVLRALQRGIEQLYRVETEVDVEDFLVDERGRDAFSPVRAPKEQLLVRQADATHDLELALFIHHDTLAHLDAEDPREHLGEHNLSDFLLAVEGVSHFVYVIDRARQERPVSQVELELQAEVDKYVISLLLAWDQQGSPPEGLRERLFEGVHFHSDLSDEEHDRYRLANHAADTYARDLERRFVADHNAIDLLAHARRFYRKGLVEKLATLTR